MLIMYNNKLVFLLNKKNRLIWGFDIQTDENMRQR